MQTIKIHWEYEDNLPEDITDKQYTQMFKLSKVDGVRLFPYVILSDSWNDERMWLT